MPSFANDVTVTVSASTKSDLKSGKYRVKSTFVLTDDNGESETITIFGYSCSRSHTPVKCRHLLTM